MKKILSYLIALSLSLAAASSVFAATKHNSTVHDPWYAGIEGGYGNTDWHFLLPFCQGNPDCVSLLSASAPLDAKDSGLFEGIYVGYQLRPHLAVEMNAVRMPTTILDFAAWTYYSQLEPGTPTELHSRTYVVDWIVKFSTPLPHSNWNLFADVGVAATHRHDRLATITHINPTFGVGLNHIYKKRYQLELFAQYAAGFDHASVTPADSYVPFILMAGLKLGVFFNT